MRYAESKYGREGLANMYHLLADFHHKRMECVGGCWLGVCVCCGLVWSVGVWNVVVCSVQMCNILVC